MRLVLAPRTNGADDSLTGQPSRLHFLPTAAHWRSVNLTVRIIRKSDLNVRPLFFLPDTVFMTPAAGVNGASGSSGEGVRPRRPAPVTYSLTGSREWVRVSNSQPVSSRERVLVIRTTIRFFPGFSHSVPAVHL